MKFLTSPLGDAQVNVLSVDGNGVPLTPVDASGSTVGAQPRIVWRSDGTGDAITWADVMAKLGTQIAVEIFSDQVLPLDIPAGVYDMNGAHFAGTFQVQINLEDGAQLANLDGGIVGGINLIGNANTIPHLTFPDQLGKNPGGPIVFPTSGFDGTISNLGSTPFFETPPPGIIYLFTINDGVFAFFESGGPIFSLVGGALIVIMVGVLQCSNDTIAGDASSLIIFINEGNVQVPPPSFSAFLGTFSNAPIGTNGNAGPTEFRPTGLLEPVPDGCRYFDTDERRQMYWDATNNAWRSPGSYVQADVNGSQPPIVPAGSVLATTAPIVLEYDTMVQVFATLNFAAPQFPAVATTALLQVVAHGSGPPVVIAAGSQFVPLGTPEVQITLCGQAIPLAADGYTFTLVASGAVSSSVGFVGAPPAQGASLLVQELGPVFP